MTETKKRLFVGIELSDSLRPSVEALIEELRARYRGPRTRIAWVKPENVHLTMKFLGSTSEELIPGIREELRLAAATVPCFEIPLKGVDSFAHGAGRLRAPYPLWIGIAEGAESLGLLKTLVERVESGLSRLGFPRETREFVPHLTIARVKELPRNLQVAPGMDPVERTIEFGSLAVRSVTLYESELSPEGSIYRKICELPLRTVGIGTGEPQSQAG